MNYNNGLSDTTFYQSVTNEELEKRARDYSEGNKDLETILLNLWKKEVFTKGCCIGHEELPKHIITGGYISFKLNSDNSYKFLNMLIDMIRKLHMDEIDIIVLDHSAGIYFSLSKRETVLSSVLELVRSDFDDYQEDSKRKQLMEALTFINTISLNFEFGITKEKMWIAVYDKNNQSVEVKVTPIFLLKQMTNPKIPFNIMFTYDELNQVIAFFQSYEHSQSDTEKNIAI